MIKLERDGEEEKIIFVYCGNNYNVIGIIPECKKLSGHGTGSDHARSDLGYIPPEFFQYPVCVLWIIYPAPVPPGQRSFPDVRPDTASGRFSDNAYGSFVYLDNTLFERKPDSGKGSYPDTCDHSYGNRSRGFCGYEDRAESG